MNDIKTKNHFNQPLVITAIALLALYAISLSSSMAGMELFGYSLAAVTLGALVTKKSPLVKLGPEWPFLALFVLVALSAIMTPTLPTALRIDSVSQMRWILLLYALTTVFIEIESWQKKFLYILFAAYALVSIYGIAQAFTGLDIIHPGSDYERNEFGGSIFWRARGFFSNTMSFAYCLGQILAFAVAFVIARVNVSKTTRIFFLATATLMALGLTFTFTRGAWVGIGVALLAVAFLYNYKLGAAALAIKVLLIVGGISLSSTVHDRLSSIINEGQSHSVSQRFDLWRANWQMFKDHPILGVGYGYNYYYTAEYNQKLLGHEGFVAQAHNNVLQVLAGSGLPGLALWLFICGYFFWLALKTFWQERASDTWLRAVALGSVGAQLFFHLGGLTQSTFFDAKPLHILLCGWALLLASVLGPKYIKLEYQSTNAKI